ncbi:unnamed protein product [Phaeothamnion confervicola]
MFKPLSRPRRRFFPSLFPFCVLLLFSLPMDPSQNLPGIRNSFPTWRRPIASGTRAPSRHAEAFQSILTTTSKGALCHSARRSWRKAAIRRSATRAATTSHGTRTAPSAAEYRFSGSASGSRGTSISWERIMCCRLVGTKF